MSEAQLRPFPNLARLLAHICLLKSVTRAILCLSLRSVPGKLGYVGNTMKAPHLPLGAIL